MAFAPFTLRDHPRIRGEHAFIFSIGKTLTGSSPHTRGARRGARRGAAVRGIIPAYAGSTFDPQSCRGECRDHPRIRGEHSGKSRSSSRSGGSSPHTRGALQVVMHRNVPPGIIPAYAGSTTANTLKHLPVRDHPRIRGEHARIIISGVIDPGSSPHTRGAPQAGQLRKRGLGIIPAYAGSTHVRRRAARSDRDHPRIRGEHS